MAKLALLTRHHPTIRAARLVLLIFGIALRFAPVAWGEENNTTGWNSLFDGKSLAHWTQDGDEVSTPAWSVEDGWIHLDRSKGKGGNILSREVFGDFELMFEWRVAEKANNGIKYRVNDFDGKVLGLEYQVIDDFNNPDLKPKHKTASIYDVYAAQSESSFLNPAGTSNFGRIVVQKDRIEHWLNGRLVAQATVGSDQWLQNIAASKFRDVPGFGVIPVGHIMLTDHKDEVWYRNVFVRRLDWAATSTPSAPTMPLAMATSQPYSAGPQGPVTYHCQQHVPCTSCRNGMGWRRFWQRRRCR